MNGANRSLLLDTRVTLLDALREQLAGGKEERAIEQQGVLADIAQFEQERDYPMQQHCAIL